jgi:type 1 glutamine amidotransferase
MSPSASRRQFLRTAAAGTLAAAALRHTSLAAAPQAKKPHVVFVVGTEHYSPHHSMPPLAKQVERLGLRTTVLLPSGDPEENKNKVGLPGLEILDQADVAVFFLRFLALADDQFAHLERFLKSGKPLVGLRTSTHAFRYKEDHPRFRWNQDFGRQVLGTSYLCHMKEPRTECHWIARAKCHPILTGLGNAPFVSPSQLYITDLAADCDPLLAGTGASPAEFVLRDRFRTRLMGKTQSDIVAWTWQNTFGARVFGTTLGHPGDFAVPQITRMVVNGIHWAAGVEIPAAATEIRTFQAS